MLLGKAPNRGGRKYRRLRGTVTAVAALIWQKDRTVSADFVRGLLNESANLYGQTDEYGNGLVDAEYALRHYDKYKSKYKENVKEVVDLTEESGINSSVEAMMAERICKEERAGRMSFLERFSEVHFDEKTRSLRLVSLRELWEDGFAMKRYMEYPCAGSLNLDKVFEEIDFYLQKGVFVIHYIDRESVCEGMNWITGILITNRKITFRTTAFNGEVLEDSLTYEAYCKRFLTFCDNNSKLRFDLYQPVTRMKQGKKGIDSAVLRKN